MSANSLFTRAAAKFLPCYFPLIALTHVQYKAICMEGSSQHKDDRDDSDTCHKAAQRVVLEVKPRKKSVYTILPSKAKPRDP